MPIPAGGGSGSPGQGGVSGWPYTTTDKVKHRMDVTDVDATRDADIAEKILASCGEIHDRTGRRFYRDAVASQRTFGLRGRVVPGVEGQRLLVPDFATTAGMTVEVGSGASFTVVTGWEAEPFDEDAPPESVAYVSLLLPGGVWSGTRARLTTVWGWPAVPTNISTAAEIQTVRLFGRKRSPEGVAGSSDWGVIRVGKTDPDFEALISGYVRPGFA